MNKKLIGIIALIFTSIVFVFICIGNYKDDLPLEQISNTAETNGELSEEVDHKYSNFNYMSTDEAESNDLPEESLGKSSDNTANKQEHEFISN